MNMTAGVAEPIDVEMSHPVVAVVEFYFGTGLALDLQLLVSLFHDPVEVHLVCRNSRCDH